MSVRVGTSGWNYPHGRGTWNGVFYPAKRTRGFDELGYYAEHFDTVEVNSTFYRVPAVSQVGQWLQRTPPSFGFSVKLYQKFTHPELYAARAGASDWHVTPGDVDEFRIAIDPLATAGRLLALLLQFPASFQCGTEMLDYVDWLAEAFSAYPLAVELRHRSWSDRSAETAARLAAHRAAWVQIDEPKFAGSIEQSLAWEHHGSSLVYVRLHGRNAAAWWAHEQAEERYDYLYRADELRPFADTARRSSAAGRRVLMYLNNHFSAKAVANAAVLKSQLGQLVTGEYPRQIVERYPELAGIAPTSGLPL